MKCKLLIAVHDRGIRMIGELNPRQSPLPGSSNKTNPKRRPHVPHVCRSFLSKGNMVSKG
jgi:hypothetical protein